MPHPLHSTARFYKEYKHKDIKANKCHIPQKIIKQIAKIKNEEYVQVRVENPLPISTLRG